MRPYVRVTGGTTVGRVLGECADDWQIVVVGTDAVNLWFRDMSVSGFATTLLNCGSFIVISLGILGEHVAKIYDEIKRRSAYLVQEAVGIPEQPASGRKQ